MNRWPDGSAYVEAVQNSANVGDSDIQQGSYERRQNDLPKPYSGGFTTTFHFTTPSGAYAVRCFTRGNDDLERRYQAITDFLRLVQHPAFCQAEYLPHGIRVNAAWWPIIKMQWVAGRTLNAEIESCLRDPVGLQRQADSFRRLVGALGVLGVAHGDLQHGNIIVANGELRLIDYDGIYLPALTGMLPSEFGHQNYQHPQRKNAPFDGRLDRFSSIVIYSALKALTYDPSLWPRFNNDENILFRASDFSSPRNSELFKVLLANPNTASLAQQLTNICDTPIANVPTLEQVLAAAGLPGSQPTYSAFSGTTSSAAAQATPRPTPSLQPMPVDTPARPVAPQPFSMPTIRVQPAQTQASAVVSKLVSTGPYDSPAFCGVCGNAMVSGATYCAKCGSGPGQSQSGLPGARFIGQWNWGAFALYPLWLMNHRRVALGIIWAILWFVPLLSLIGAIYFGRQGTRIAVLSGRFRYEGEFISVQNAWRNWGIGFFIIVIVLAILSSLGSTSATTANKPAPGRNSTRVAGVVPSKAHASSGTGNCDSPNRQDAGEMEDSIAQFHRSVSEHQWSEAERYETTATYQSTESMKNGYARTIESIPTVTAINGCHISVTLKFQNSDSPQYCIDQVYDMTYVRWRQPSWLIRDAKSVSDKRLCA